MTKSSSRIKLADAREIEPLCPYAKICGGCDMQHLNYNDQLIWKQKRVEDLLGGFGVVEQIIGMEDPTYYRNKVHATFQVRRRRVVSGMYEENTHKVVDINNCMIQSKKAIITV